VLIAICICFLTNGALVTDMLRRRINCRVIIIIIIIIKRDACAKFFVTHVLSSAINESAIRDFYCILVLLHLC